MHFLNSGLGLGRISAAVLAATIGLATTTGAMAWSRFHDEIYADSFGNLVIQSPSGSKRIVVGQGHLAKDLSQYERTGDSDVVYLDEDTERDGRYEYRDCYRPPYLWKGRSYMYGLPDGVVPQAPCVGD